MTTHLNSVNPDRRTLLTGVRPPLRHDQAHFDAVAAERASRLSLLRKIAPNVPLITEDSRHVRFYDDVLKNRQVIFSAMYSVCEKNCPPAMRNLIEARELLGPLAQRLTFVTMTLTPLDDGPQQLKAYKQRYGLGADWLFLTGRPESVETLQAALGYAATRPTDDALTHASKVRICDERNMRWGHVNSLTSAYNIARMVRFELA